MPLLYYYNEQQRILRDLKKMAVFITLISQCKTQTADCRPGVNPGGGVLKKVLYGEAPHQGPTSYPFIYHFFRKGTPLVYLLKKTYEYIVKTGSPRHFFHVACSKLKLNSHKLHLLYLF